MKTIIAILFTVCAIANAQITSNDISAKHYTGEVTIQAAPQAVFGMITNCEKHCALMGGKHISGSTTYSKVGSTSYTEIDGGDKGTEVVTYFKPSKEIRISFEPDNGTYLCGEKWVLTPSGNGTKVHYDETYTMSGPMDANALNHCTEMMNKGLNDLKTWCEKK